MSQAAVFARAGRVGPGVHFDVSGACVWGVCLGRLGEPSKQAEKSETFAFCCWLGDDSLLAVENPHGINVLVSFGQCIDDSAEQHDAGVIVGMIVDERGELASGLGQVGAVECLECGDVSMCHLAPIFGSIRLQFVQGDWFLDPKGSNDGQAAMVESSANRLRGGIGDEG